MKKEIINTEVFCGPLTLEESFKYNCKVINLKYEYVGYKGTEQWAIVSELSKDELMMKYAAIVSDYTPFILLSVAQGEAMAEYDRIEDKFRKRNMRYGHIFDVNDGEFEQHHPEFAVEPDYIEMLEQQDEIDRLHIAIDRLTPIQKRRLQKYFFEEKTYKEIADEENSSFSAVRESVFSALNSLKKICNYSEPLNRK